MATPPRGTLAFSGFGDAPIQFVSPAGVLLSLGITADCGAGCDGIVALSGGNVGVIGGNTPNFGTTGTGTFSPDFATTVDSAAGANGFPSGSSARDDNDQFYGVGARTILGVTSGYIYRYNASGVQIASWAISFGATAGFWNVQGVAVNGAGTIAYVGSYDSLAIGFPPATTVYAWDLVGNVSLGVFKSEAGYKLLGDNAIVALTNGDVLIGWSPKFPTTGDGYVKHYDASGTLLHTYTLAASGNDYPLQLTRGLTDATIWCSFYDGNATTSSGVSVVEITLGTGALSTPFSPDDGAGFEFDGSFTVLTAGDIPRLNSFIVEEVVSSSSRTYGPDDEHAVCAIGTDKSEGWLLALWSAIATRAKALGAAIADDGTPILNINGPNEDIQVNTIPTTWVHKATVSLTAAQIKLLKTTPVQVLAAPGANTAVIPIAAILNFIAGGTQMTSGGAVSLVDHGTHTNVLAGSVPAATIQSASSSATHLGQQAGANGLARPANTAIDIEAATADFATGNGTAVVHLWYCLIPTNQ
jgi:hypothetical protein